MTYLVSFAIHILQPSMIALTRWQKFFASTTISRNSEILRRCPRYRIQLPFSVWVTNDAVPRKDIITVVGSITIHDDGPSSTVKLTDSTIALQASRSTGSGVVVPLHFDPGLKVRGNPRGIASTSLFPGAIVALCGKNGGGGWFLVVEVLVVGLKRFDHSILTESSNSPL